jgi:molybdopterin synthase sulfur carrier subunit
MQVQVMLFGQLTDIAGNNTIVVDDVSDTDELVQVVNTLYPAITSIKYIIAVDKKAIQANTTLNQRSNVALLPAFSGG